MLEDRILLLCMLEDWMLLTDCAEIADDTDDMLLDERGIFAAQVVIVAVSVVTVPPNASAIPYHEVLAPTVIPAASMIVPANIVLAARVVACIGVQKILHAEAPFSVTIAPAVEVKAPSVRKMKVPLPVKLSAPPISIAPVLQ